MCDEEGIFALRERTQSKSHEDEQKFDEQEDGKLLPVVPDHGRGRWRT